MTFPRIEQLTLSPRSPKTQDQMQNDYNRTSSAVKTWMIVVIVIVLLVVIGGGVFTAVVLCRIRRRNARQRNASAYYGAKSHDVEMTPPTYSAPNSHQVAQLPTNDEGGEDLKGNPKLEFEGNPVYQLDNHDRPRGPFELPNPIQHPEASHAPNNGAPTLTSQPADSSAVNQMQNVHRL